MKLLLVRHGIAVAPDQWPEADGDRPLTSKGRKQVKRQAKAARLIIDRLDAVLTSPLLRAEQTADLFAGQFQAKKVDSPELAAGDIDESFLEQLSSYPEDACVALVGHDPSLSTFLGWVTTGTRCTPAQFKKGGVCLIESAGRIVPGQAQIVWLLPPGTVRKLQK